MITETVQQLGRQGLRCGIVTNDQSEGLVDSAMARLSTSEAAVGEVTGACFCCQLDSLVATVRELATNLRPDVLLCEPVGSCTDLRATVLLPLAEIYRMEVRLAPFTAVLDSRRAQSLFRPATTGRKKGFAKEVTYIFRKQIEEADVLFLNKCDRLTAEEQQSLLEALRERFPDKLIFPGSAREGDGVADWLHSWAGDDLPALSPREGAEVLEIDYDRYAYGEALLGWYNASLEVSANAEWSGDEWLLAQARKIAHSLSQADMEVAHFKMSLQSEEPAASALAVVNQVLAEEEPVLSRALGAPLQKGNLLINLRAEGEAEKLQKIVREALLESDDLTLNWQQESFFQPGKPQPTHRLAATSHSFSKAH
ncbi:hypothetical protein JIN78_12295 [Roseibacillus ishigakijimensis]|uniref:CobW/HypB/UreG nucleotide-binding domain-containing protein n=1 Tax=Roseibacillus ishigakijimensis TaxID=454146 RepID=A0A934VI96_9BACT|nr:hypothetical protein [Roseibacillus ishigakijimensis]